MTLRIVTRTDVDALADRLLDWFDEATRAGDADPFEPLAVLVPSLATGRWLRERRARASGACVNWLVDYPGRFVWRAFALADPELPAQAPFDPAATRWWLHDRLGRLAEDRRAGRVGADDTAAFAPLFRLLDADDELDRFRLAEGIARTFDRYLTDRIDWMGRRLALPNELLAHAHAGWQQRLWAELVDSMAGLGDTHPYGRFRERLPGLDAAGLRRRLGARVAFFGAPTLAPLHLNVLSDLAERVDVTLFLVNPCREFWQDIVSPVTRARLDTEIDPAAARLFDVAHPLLACWGKAARDGLQCIDRLTLGREVEDDHEEPAPVDEALPFDAPVLARLREAIRSLRPGLLGDARPERLLVGREDPDEAGFCRAHRPGACASVQIHACHGLLRQAEVLHDLLLDAFATVGRTPGDPAGPLQPHEVAVLAPHVDDAAAAIEAVFAAAPEALRIPLRVSGRAREVDPLVEGSLRLLRWAVGRAGADELLDVLADPSMRRALGLPDDAPDRLRAWLHDAGLRAGVSGARHAADLAIDRLLMGAAMASDDDGWGEVGVAGDAEGDAITLLDRLVGLLEALRPFADGIRRPIAGWRDSVHRALERLFGAACRRHEGLARLGASAGDLRAASDAPVGATVAIAALADRCAANAPGAVATGAVTVGPLDALAGLPWRMVVVFGADDGALPRIDRVPEWDLCAARPRLGDRFARLDDRGAVLSALLGARDRFVVLYTGRDLRKDDPLNAAQPVEELREHLRLHVGVGGYVDQRHTLHRGDVRNFAGAPEAASFDPVACAVATALETPVDRRPLGAFIAQPGSGGDGGEGEGSVAVGVSGGASLEPWTIPLAELAAMLVDPPEFHLGHALGVHPRFERRTASRDDEPIACDDDDHDALVADAIARMFAGQSPARISEAVRRHGRLPGRRFTPGALARVIGDAEWYVDRVRAEWGDPRRPGSVPFDLRVEFDGRPVHLVGRIGAMHEGGRVLRLRRTIAVAGTSRPAPRELLRAWVHHLALCMLGEGVPTCALVHPLDVTRFRPLDREAALAGLADLVRLRCEALRAPLVFAPKTSLQLHVAAGRVTEAAEQAWTGGFGSTGESGYAGFRMAWRDRPPTIDALVPTALRVFEPIDASVDTPLRADGSIAEGDEGDDE